MLKSMVLITALTGFCVAGAGCGTSRSDRALSGAALGAGAGALIGGVTGGSAGTGALIGGAAGAAAGGLTHKDDVNLGKPVWRR